MMNAIDMPTHLRMRRTGNETDRLGHQIVDVLSLDYATRVDVAAFLDDAHIKTMEVAGYEGRGAGVWVEAVWIEDDEDPRDVSVWSQPYDRVEKMLADLPVGTREECHREIEYRKDTEVWDGNNYILVQPGNLIMLADE